MLGQGHPNSSENQLSRCEVTNLDVDDDDDDNDNNNNSAVIRRDGERYNSTF